MNSHFENRLRESKVPSVITTYFSDQSCPDSMAPEILAQFQEEAVKEVITRAYKNSPFYHRKMTQAGVTPQDIKNIADLAKMPFTAKDELRQDPWALLGCDKKEISFIHVSTGTTGGKQIYGMFSWRDYYLQHAITYPKLFPVCPGDICFISLPYEISSAGLAYHYKFMVGHQATILSGGKGGAYSTPEKAIRLMRNLKPTIVVTSPSYAITLAEAASEASFDLTSLKLKKMWLSGEGCSSAFRKRVEKIWGTTANFSYGSMELSGMGAECDAQNGYHISQGHVLIEIVDPETGEVLEEGKIGEIVATCLLRFDTPIIRYRTQDFGYIDSTPCDCGVPLQRLHLRGRKVDQIILQGKAFSPFYLEEVLMRLPEVGNWYQFVVKSGNNEKLKVRSEVANDIKPTSELASELAGKIAATLGVPCELEFVDRIPRVMTKVIRVVRE
jgi:phenylacetate-CoA ligase